MLNHQFDSLSLLSNHTIDGKRSLNQVNRAIVDLQQDIEVDVEQGDLVKNLTFETDGEKWAGGRPIDPHIIGQITEVKKLKERFDEHLAMAKGVRTKARIELEKRIRFYDDQGECTMFDKDRSNNGTTLHTIGEDAPTSRPSITGCIETTTSSLPPNEHTNVKQLVLNKSGNPLEIVLEALKTQNTDRIADSAVLGTCAILTNIETIVFTRIISSIKMNCVNSNLTILTSVLEIGKERLQEYEQNRLN